MNPFRFAAPPGVVCVLVAAASSSVWSATPDIFSLVPMRDGVALATDVYLPEGSGPWPAILLRTPYDKTVDGVSDPWIEDVNGREYAYVAQDTRGRFASQGADSVFWTDGWGALQDGYDTIDWVATQTWCDGNVGMHGGSARGILEYMAAGASHPALKACVARAATGFLYPHGFFQGGEVRESLVNGWFASVNNTLMKEFYLAHPLRDSFWESVDIGTRTSSITVPILHYGGYFDIFTAGARDAYALLQDQGGPGAAGEQRIVIGPWAHDSIELLDQGELTFPIESVYGLNELRWRWYDHYLRGIDNGVDTEPPISLYVMGDVDDPATGNYWLDLSDFTSPETQYLIANPTANANEAVLLPHDAPGGTFAFTYTFDPGNPIPTRGGQNLYEDQGPYDQRAVHLGRSDLITMLTPVITSPFTVVGEVEVTLTASISTPDTDWCVKLIDVYPDGRQMLLSDTVLRARFRNGTEVEELVTPGNIHVYRLGLWTTAIEFAVGHKLGVVVTNSNYPRFGINPNTGAPFGDNSDPVPCDVSLYANQAHRTYVRLPIRPGVVGVDVTSYDPAGLRVMPRANPARRFVLDLPDVPVTRLDIFDVSGRRVREFVAADREILVWDGRRTDGRRAAPGVYFARPAFATPFEHLIGAGAPASRLVLID